MRVLGRLILVPLALLFAIPAGAVALVFAAFFDPVLGALGADIVGAGFFARLDELLDTGEPEALAAPFSRLRNAALMLLVVPPVFVGLVGEVAGWRAFVWYAGGTGAVAAAMPWLARPAPRPATLEELHVTGVLLCAGAVAGAVYWLIAGSSAGRRPTLDERGGGPP